ncbi:hypothetical protein Bca4012_009795 [Brassica carinata]|uniref:Elicitor peptide 6 n=1 Tax=Brassica carinata TaxID=52824 RepID=A0A8X7S6V8_BRACI|nr:hypothetical protein Bca52824_035026 [Brassica carinata]
MEVNGEEKKSSRREDEEKEVNYHPLLNSPCTAFHKTVQAILKCLGLESSSISPSSSSSEDPGTEIVQETGFMAMVARLTRRRPRPPYSSGQPGQIN